MVLRRSGDPCVPAPAQPALSREVGSLNRSFTSWWVMEHPGLLRAGRWCLVPPHTCLSGRGRKGGACLWGPQIPAPQWRRESAARQLALSWAEGAEGSWEAQWNPLSPNKPAGLSAQPSWELDPPPRLGLQCELSRVLATRPPCPEHRGSPRRRGTRTPSPPPRCPHSALCAPGRLALRGSSRLPSVSASLAGARPS